MLDKGIGQNVYDSTEFGLEHWTKTIANFIPAQPLHPKWKGKKYNE